MNAMRKKDICAKYMIDIRKLNGAIGKGIVNMRVGGYVDEESVQRWLGDIKDAGVTRKPKSVKVNGAGLIDDDIIKRLKEFNPDNELLDKVLFLEKYYKSQANAAQEQDKQLKIMAEASRLVDLKEMEAELNDFLFPMIAYVKTLSDQVGDRIARDCQIDKAKVGKALEIVSEDMVKLFEKTADAMHEKAEKMEINRTAEAKRRENKR